jgi:hypothetical protein
VSISLAMFLVFVAGTLGITASRHSRCGRLLRCGRKDYGLAKMDSPLPAT